MIGMKDDVFVFGETDEHEDANKNWVIPTNRTRLGNRQAFPIKWGVNFDLKR